MHRTGQWVVEERQQMLSATYTQLPAEHVEKAVKVAEDAWCAAICTRIARFRTCALVYVVFCIQCKALEATFCTTRPVHL